MLKVNFLGKHKLSIFIICLLVVAMQGNASQAEAAWQGSSWQTSSVSIQAQIETDGQMSVVDQRTLHLNDANTIANWEIARTTDKSQIEVSSVRLISAQNEKVEVKNVELGVLTEDVKRSLDESKFESEKEQCFFNEEDSWFYVYLPREEAEADVLIEVSYTIKNAFYVYDDVAEVYWDYLPQAKISDFERLFVRDTATQISCVVLIPSDPETEILNKKTVWGWGHGFNGTVEFLNAGAYKFESQTNLIDKNSRAHIIFPRSCLVNFEKGSVMDVGGARKNNAIKEEEEWSDESKIIVGNVALVSSWFVGLAVAVLVAITLAYFRITKRYDKMLEQGVSFNEQQNFDKQAQKFQRKMMITSVFALIVCLFCLIYLKNVFAGVAFLLLFMLCIVFANWTPTIHTSFRDKLLHDVYVLK